MKTFEIGELVRRNITTIVIYEITHIAHAHAALRVVWPNPEKMELYYNFSEIEKIPTDEQFRIRLEM